MNRDEAEPTVVTRPVGVPPSGDGIPVGVDEELAMARISRNLGGGSNGLPTIGRYAVIERLGAGGMGLVLRAYDPRMHREVALKVLRPASGEPTSEARARLLREAQAMAQLRHPNVVDVYDAEQTERGICMVMEYVEGQTFRQWVRETPRSQAEILEVVGAVARGLAAAHQSGLVHRDVKPDNVLIGRDGRVRIADFGLARSVATLGSAFESDSAATGSGAWPSTSELTRDGAVMGTPAYMAPEQHHGEPADARADQFALCVMLWEALYGSRPFTGKNADDLVEAKEGPLPPRPASTVPGWLHAVMVRGLALDPGDRFETCEALAAALTVGATRTRRRRIAGGLALATCVVLGGVGWRQLDRAQRREACAAAGAEIAELWSTATPPTAARAWADRWSESRRTACIAATVDRTLSADLHERSRACFDELRAELEAMVPAEASSERGEPGPSDVGWTLPDPADCQRAAHLERRPALPDDGPRRESVRTAYRRLAFARGLARAGRRADALDVATGVLDTATSLDHPPLSAAARLRVGALQRASGRALQAERSLRLAFSGAGGDFTIAASAAVELLATVGPDPRRGAEAQAWGTSAQMLVGRVQRLDDELGARLFHHRAEAARAAGDFDAAVDDYAQALAIGQARWGSEHPSLVPSLEGLAAALDALDRSAEARRHRARARAIAPR